MPEIHSGTVEIKAIAREAGSRSKVAVASRQEGLDPVGATVGQRGGRVQAVVAELGGEKIDIIPWNEDPAVFVANALSPAQVVKVDIDEENRIASVTVPERMLSLAIGREGQNARLAAKPDRLAHRHPQRRVASPRRARPPTRHQPSADEARPSSRRPPTAPRRAREAASARPRRPAGPSKPRRRRGAGRGRRRGADVPGQAEARTKKAATARPKAAAAGRAPRPTPRRPSQAEARDRRQAAAEAARPDDGSRRRRGASPTARRSRAEAASAPTAKKAAPSRREVAS